MKTTTSPELNAGVLRFVKNKPEREDDETLDMAMQRMKRDSDPEEPEEDEPVAVDPPRWSMLVQVKQGRLRGEVLAPGEESIRPFSNSIGGVEVEGLQVERQLHQVLIDRGLTESEAGGLLDCWREQFFARDGLRVLTLLSPREYDAFCPMMVRPPPTEVVRVGIVMTELSEAIGTPGN